MWQAARNGLYGAFWRVDIFILQAKTCGSIRFSPPALCVCVCVCVCVESSGDSIHLVFFESFHALLKLSVELSLSLLRAFRRAI